MFLLELNQNKMTSFLNQCDSYFLDAEKVGSFSCGKSVFNMAENGEYDDLTEQEPELEEIRCSHRTKLTNVLYFL